MERLDNIREKITDYMNGVPVEKRKSVVIAFSAAIGLLLVAKCAVSIMTADKPRHTLTEKMDSIKTEMRAGLEEAKSDIEETAARKDSFVTMLEELERRHPKDTTKR